MVSLEELTGQLDEISGSSAIESDKNLSNGFRFSDNENAKFLKSSIGDYADFFFEPDVQDTTSSGGKVLDYMEQINSNAFEISNFKRFLGTIVQARVSNHFAPQLASFVPYRMLIAEFESLKLAQDLGDLIVNNLENKGLAYKRTALLGDGELTRKFTFPWVAFNAEDKTTRLLHLIPDLILHHNTNGRRHVVEIEVHHSKHKDHNLKYSMRKALLQGLLVWQSLRPSRITQPPRQKIVVFLIRCTYDDETLELRNWRCEINKTTALNITRQFFLEMMNVDKPLRLSHILAVQLQSGRLRSQGTTRTAELYQTKSNDEITETANILNYCLEKQIRTSAPTFPVLNAFFGTKSSRPFSEVKQDYLRDE